MREFKKSSKLDNVLYDVRGPVVDEAARMEREGQHILKLNIGNPAAVRIPHPDEVTPTCACSFPNAKAIPIRAACFRHARRSCSMPRSSISPMWTWIHIYTGNGVSELIQMCMQALLDAGDEVLIPRPIIRCGPHAPRSQAAPPVHYLCDEQADWYPDIADMESKITPRTKAIVIINPNNPTGAVYPREVLQEIVEVARRHQLMISPMKSTTVWSWTAKSTCRSPRSRPICSA